MTNANFIPRVELPCIGKANKNNVGPVVFNGDISITQKAAGNRCTLRLCKSEYSLQENRFVLGTVDDNEMRMFVGCFSMTGQMPACRIDTDKGDDESNALASACPLAKLSSTFKEIRLVVSYDMIDWKQDVGTVTMKTEVLKGQLTHLCTVHSLATPESRWSQIMKTDMKALRSESEAKEKRFGTMRCRILTHAGKGDRSVLVEVFPSEPPKDRSVDVKEYDWEIKKVGESYRLKAPVNFPTDEDTMAEHKIFGGGKTTGWVLNVVKNTMGYEAPIVGVLSNFFDDISSFIGLEEGNAALEPLFNDILGDRANQFLSYPKYPPQIPAADLFGTDECNEEANKLATHIELPLSLKTTVSASQFRAVQTILNRKISVTWGAPCTGKSRVLSEAMLWLLENTNDCMVGMAETNVAVDALLGKVVEGYRSRHLQSEIPIARVYSQSQITAQYATGELHLIDEEYHLETLRVKRARTDARFSGFLEAVDQLREFGSIKSEGVHNAYIEEGRELTRMTLEDNVRIVFCTVTGCQSTALYKVHGTDKIEWAYPAKSAFLDDAGTMTRPMMEMPVLAFVKTLQRLSIAGDPYQLPAFIHSTFAKTEWPNSWLKQIMDHRWPVSFLDTQYRMYDMLYDHLISVIYAGALKVQGLETIRSVKSVTDLTAFGLRLKNAMPIRFEVSNRSYALDSIESFIDVPNGVQRRPEAGSSWNIQEIDAIDSAIMKLVSLGFRQEDIAVITGYSEQKRLLTERAKKNGWSGVKQITTVDSSQGVECRIVFVSLVTTRNMDGCMGTRYRACVGTSRQTEALYFVGNADYWFTRIEGAFKYMHNILKHIRYNRSAWNQPPFIVGPSTQTAPPTHAAKGKGKEVDTPIASDPVTVPASEILKTFMQKANERRAAARAAAVEELAAMERKHFVELAKLEQEQSETQRLLEEEIATELEALRFDVHMEGS